MNKKCLIDILGITMAILCAIITGIFGRAWNGGYIFYMFSFLVSGSLIYFLIKDFSLKRELGNLPLKKFSIPGWFDEENALNC